jgi:hypothetical protein
MQIMQVFASAVIGIASVLSLSLYLLVHTRSELIRLDHVAHSLGRHSALTANRHDP